MDEALREMALTQVQRQIGYYRRRIRALERKHRATFDVFSDRLQGKATPAEEDDWLAWRSALSMAQDWEQTYLELRRGGPGQ
jgi:hypothetical protein